MTDATARAEVSIRAVRVSKWYGQVTALQALSLHLEAGIWGLLGPNGSGKTTLMNLAAGQFRPSLGEIRVADEAPYDNPRALRRIGLCPEADALYDDFTAHEFVSIMAELSGFGRDEAADRAAKSLAALDLDKDMHRPIAGYSRGMRQRAKLAQALVHDPDVLLLDEPLTGTDPISRQVILEHVRARAKAGALVLFSTHVLHEVETLTDRVLLIVRGQLVAQGRTADIRAMMHDRPHHVRVVTDRARDLAAALIHRPSVAAVYVTGESTVTVATREPDRTYDDIATLVVDGRYAVTELTSPDATLDALFHELVERASSAAGTGADAGVGPGSRGAPQPSAAQAPRSSVTQEEAP